MPQLNPYQGIQIGSKNNKAILSKSQQEFNRLTNQIETLTASMHYLREASTYVYERIQTDYHPLVEQYNQYRARIVRLFDRAYDSSETTKTEKRKLAHLIQSIALELMSQQGMEELKPVYDKYQASGFYLVNAVADEQAADLAKGMASDLFSASLEANAINPQSKSAHGQDEMEEGAAETQHQRSAKQKSTKKQERQAKKEAEAYKITKAVRQLYMDLVKAFHPDREPDEAEKGRKTEIMHRITAAYQKSDLLALLRLQLEFERIDQAHLENLAGEQLKYYNKILRQQTQELDNELMSLQNDLAAIMGKPAAAISSRTALEFSLNSAIAQLKREVKQIKSDVKALSSLDQLQQWLKTYRIDV